MSFGEVLGCVAFAEAEQGEARIGERSCSDGIEDLCRGITLCSDLPFSNDPHRLKATNCNPCRSKPPKAQRGPASLFDGPMVLLDNVVQIFVLTNFDIGAFVAIIGPNAGGVGSAFVDGDFYRFAV